MFKLLFLISNFLFAFYTINANATVKVVASVDGNAITDNDVKQRAAFLRLQHATGDLDKKAKDQLIAQMIKNLEIQKHNAQLSEKEIDARFKEFAQKNGMDRSQLSLMLAQNNITPDHFKNFIATQVGWQKLLLMRYRSEHGSADLLNAQEAAHRQLEAGAEKPKTWEYKIQKITFVMPDKRTDKIKKARLRAIHYFKQRFRGCDSSYIIASKLLDVVINEEGRILEPQLSTEWSEAVKHTLPNTISKPIETSDGLVAFAVCDKRQVDDDRVAQLIYSIKDTQQNSNQIMKDLDAKYLSELKAKARIVN